MLIFNLASIPITNRLKYVGPRYEDINKTN